MKLIKLAVIGLLLLLSTVVSAQEDDLQPIYEHGEDIRDLFWSSDSRQLTFKKIVPSLSEPLQQPWVAYDPISSEYTEMAMWSLQASVLVSVSRILTDDIIRSEQSRVLLSPDGRYVVTSARMKSDEWNTTVIVDVVEDRVIDTSIRAQGIGRGSHFFNVTWSDDSEVFMLATSAALVSEPSFFYWVSNYVNDTTAPDVREITSFDIDDWLYTTLKVYDVSNEGQNVLVHSVYSTPDPYTRQTFYPLIVWDSEGDHQVLIDEFDKRSGVFNLLTASFAPDDENDILVIDERGLVRYSLDTGETVILRTDINSTRFKDARFSPNGELLALVEDTPNTPTTVYTFDVTNTFE